MMSADVLAYHVGGKIALRSRVPLRDRDDLSLAYTPGVAEVCRAISRDPAVADRYTARANFIAVVTDGSAVLGLGNLGPAAALPVMEGKCVLLGHLGGVDAVPLCLNRETGARLADVIAAVAPTFGGILLEDVAAPECFALEAELGRRLDIPVVHDDQHGTAVVVGAAILSALRATNRQPAQTRAVVNGAGASGIRVAEMLLDLGLGDVVVCDRQGVLAPGRSAPMTAEKETLSRRTNRTGLRGGLSQAVRGADAFVGLSVGGALTFEMAKTMAPASIVFALANPDPEIAPVAARAAGAAIVGTGRSEDPNQINNALCFPGLFRGLLDAGARGLSAGGKRAAARAIAALLTAGELERGIVVPDIFNPDVAPAVAGAVAEAAWTQGLAAHRIAASDEAQQARTRIANWG